MGCPRRWWLCSLNKSRGLSNRWVTFLFGFDNTKLPIFTYPEIWHEHNTPIICFGHLTSTGHNTNTTRNAQSCINKEDVVSWLYGLPTNSGT